MSCTPLRLHRSRLTEERDRPARNGARRRGRGMTPDMYPLIPADARITADPPMLVLDGLQLPVASLTRWTRRRSRPCSRTAGSRSCGTGRTRRPRPAGGPPGRTAFQPDLRVPAGAPRRAEAGDQPRGRDPAQPPRRRPDGRPRPGRRPPRRRVPAAHRHHRGQGLLEPRDQHRHRPATSPLPAAAPRLGRDLPDRYFHHPGGEHESYADTPATAGKTRRRRRHRTRGKHKPEQILADLRRQQAAAAPADIRVRVLQLPLVPPPEAAAGTPQV
jgi:hypothetical protein